MSARSAPPYWMTADAAGRPDSGTGSQSYQKGAEVSGRLLDGQQVTGIVTFLAASADPVSRSYRIEIEVDSAGEKIREGITTEILVKATS